MSSWISAHGDTIVSGFWDTVALAEQVAQPLAYEDTLWSWDMHLWRSLE